MGSKIRRHAAATLASTAIAAATVVGTGLLVEPSATAATDTMQLTAISAPVWLPGHAIPVTVTAINPDAALFCGSVRLRLTWWQSGSHRHAKSALVQPTVGAAGTTMTIPAGYAHAGTLHYRVRGDQTCGLLDQPDPTYRGHSSTKTVQIA